MFAIGLFENPYRDPPQQRRLFKPGALAKSISSSPGICGAVEKRRRLLRAQ